MGTNKYCVIYVPTEHRKLFPDYGKSFTIHTDDGNILTHITSKSKSFPKGCYFTTGMRPWFRKNKLTANDNLVIEIIKPLKNYRLTIARDNE